MRDTLIIINYMRTNPTIVDDLVIKTKSSFEKIYVINRNTNSKYENIINIPGVEVREVKKRNRVLLIPKSIFSMFRKERIEDIIFAIKTKRFTKDFIIMMFKNVHIANLLYEVVSKIEELKTKPEKVSLLSVWFTSEAYVISRIKEKYPKVKGISMAHAHEIETFDNKYTFWDKKFMQHSLDKVCFIAGAKMKVYEKEVCQKRGIRTSNMELLYWGSEYINFGIQRKTKGDKKIVVSCSTVEELKRVNMIAEAIRLIKRHDIEWYHFGDGASMSELQKLVKEYDESIQKKIHLVGRVDNREVKRFYATNEVELFINVSTTEGLPISVMEALSYSIPALVTDVGGEREIIDNNINGYIVPSDITAEYIANLIERHLDLDDKTLDNMKVVAKKKWEEKFNLDTNILRYIEELR